MIEFPKIIKDGDLELIKPEPTFENAAKLFNLVEQNRAHFGEWLEWVQYIKTPEDEFSQVVKMAKSEIGSYIIQFNGKFVGTIGFISFSEKHRMGEIGYMLSANVSGRGIMTRAVTMYENLVFDKLGFNRIEIRMDVRNVKSASVPRRLGYHLDGELRENAIDSSGKLRNTYIYSKLKSEWKQGK